MGDGAPVLGGSGDFPLRLRAELSAEVYEEVLRAAARRLIDDMEGQEVCFCCWERLTMDSPQQGHLVEECSYLHLREALNATEGEVVVTPPSDNFLKWFMLSGAALAIVFVLLGGLD